MYRFALLCSSLMLTALLQPSATSDVSTGKPPIVPYTTDGAASTPDVKPTVSPGSKNTQNSTASGSKDTTDIMVTTEDSMVSNKDIQDPMVPEKVDTTETLFKATIGDLVKQLNKTRQPKIGSRCKEDSDCPANVTCDWQFGMGEVCSCPTEYIPTEDNTGCMADPEWCYGMKDCEQDEQCCEIQLCDAGPFRRCIWLNETCVGGCGEDTIIQ